jgi:hypothetical protein
MRFLLTVIGCCVSLISLAQSKPQQSLRIQITYEKEGRYLEQAVQTIEAVNKVGNATSLEYRAGQAITLSPGFETRTGGTFLAQIKTVSENGEAPLQLAAFPNPFEQSTTIEYYLPASGKVNLSVMNAQGQIISRLVQDEEMSAGRHQIEWKANSTSSGVYIPVVEVNQQKAASRMVKK